MKKILTLFAVIGLIAFSSCEGPEGPPGPPGETTVAPVIDVNNVNFASNGDGEVIDFGFTLFPGDVVLAYRATGVANGSTVWSPIPESHYYDDGSLFFTYKFNFSRVDFELYLDGFNLNTVPADLRTNQKFRILVVPGDDPRISNKSVDKKDLDYNTVIAKYNIDDSNVKTINL
ncbi:hypothetical protein [Flavobacterium nitrogenifigens]|uniref:Collagen triple helix repeat-containing protein n=1 Tax=Flavobacterium nitrogenifigens TaxID=1617283 RepID=A0A521APC2_9FLAO|nr:hypothetical protein [Flavobacterium nitrogenifigens]KAF2329365.1 hypothetical protein DM397_16955 [Flavobacterium nitrogenifigens]SMO36500.1 hypothetical protein SAMN06265220_101316 [Flavobacterium nitrogenifigens]